MRLFAGVLLLATFSAFQISSKSGESTPGTPGTPGIKMAVRFSVSGMSGEQTIYVQGDRRRMEYRNAFGGRKRSDGTYDLRYGPHLAAIVRCDLGKSYELNLDDKQYVVTPYPPKPLTKNEMKAQGILLPQTAPQGPATLRVETTTADTGEKKDFFGHVARHVITTRKEIPLGESASVEREFVTDAWYIDLEPRASCEHGLIASKGPTASTGGFVVLRAQLVGGNAPPERIEYVQKGTPETGFAVERKTTYREAIAGVDGTKREDAFTNETTITQLVEAQLEPTVFEIPSEFRKVESINRNPPPTIAELWNNTREWFTSVTRQIFR